MAACLACLACSRASRPTSETQLEGRAAVAGGSGQAAGASGTQGGADLAWVGSWVSAQQLTEPRNLPPAPGFPSSTLRQIAQLSLGGHSIRITFSNLYGNAPLSILRAHVARSAGGSAIDAASDTPLLFAGSASVIIPPGAQVVADAVTFEVPALTNLAVSVALDAAPPSDVTGHPGSRTTSFLQPGDAVSQAELGPAALSVDHWYFLSSIDVLTGSGARAVVTLGDSITDGRGSTTNQNDRWPNQLSRRLLAAPETALISVLNQGIGGNRILGDGLGPSALSRFERDALSPPGVRWVVVLEGINDLGSQPTPAAQTLIAAYRQMITRAHARNVSVYGGTIMPFQGFSTFSPQTEAIRQAINGWMRQSGEFDKVIDFDAITRDAAAPSQLSLAVDGGDHLHPSAAGYALMAGAIDLGLFRN
jgi:lysophospholipase L1-like esterase